MADRLDALALAVHYWTDAVARDVQKVAQQTRQGALDRELRVFMQHVVGGKPGRASLIGRGL